MSRASFEMILYQVLNERHPLWQENAQEIEIDLDEVYTLIISLKRAILASTKHSEEPVNNPVVRTMSIKDFVSNMFEAYGFAKN